MLNCTAITLVTAITLITAIAETSTLLSPVPPLTIAKVTEVRLAEPYPQEPMTGPLAGKRIIVYGRHSSSMQNERSADDQVRRCIDYALAAGADIKAITIIKDEAVSGASLLRPGFNGVTRAIDQGAVDVIVVEDTSRVSRDMADSAGLLKKLRYAGVQLIGVGDGIDTDSKTAKVTWTMLSLAAETQVDSLSDKTLRGLEEKFRTGFSTGGLLFGYKCVAKRDPDGKLGRFVIIDEDAAAVVRHIFDLYLQGVSLDGIARTLNDEQVPPARATTKHRRKGWVASSVRAILHNEAYIGIATFKKRYWVKVPGTNTRRPKNRDRSQVMTREDPDRRIIAPEIWNAVQGRLSAVRMRYTAKATARSAPGARTSYPLSGLLTCAVCGAPMVITAGTSARYYRCGDNKKRGSSICRNTLSLREDVARSCIYSALKAALFTPDAIAHLRRRIAEHLGESGRLAQKELDERHSRLARTEQRIHGLVTFIADGDHSQYIRDTLRDLEAQATAEKAAIQAIKDGMAAPVDLPTPDRILERAMDLDAVLAGDPLRAREALRRMFDGGRIMLTPGDDGIYVAEGTFLPLVALAQTTKPPAEGRGLHRGTAIGCGGRI